jgi:hypothetical protein
MTPPRSAKPGWGAGRRDSLNGRGWPDYSTSPGSLDLRGLFDPELSDLEARYR